MSATDIARMARIMHYTYIQDRQTRDGLPNNK